MGAKIRKVVRISKVTREITGVYDNAKEAAEAVDISESRITYACRKGTVSAGYKWRYALPGEFEKEKLYESTVR